MSFALHRNLTTTPSRAVRGDGPYIIDDAGRRYLDGCGGAAVSCLGHSHPAVIKAIQEQASRLPYAHTSFFTTDVLEELAEVVVEGAPGMGKVLLLSGGSEAIEAALKLSRQYFVESGQPEKHLFIARRQSYHGNTLGALAVGGNEWRREFFRPLMVANHNIAPCFEYRDRAAEETQDQYCERVALELEEKIVEIGSEKVAGFVAETVVGGTAGAVVPSPGYFKRIREICDRYGVHLILDEVMCGTGRTGSMMAYQQEGIIPDIVTMAKGLAAGYQPVGALLCRPELIDVIRNKSGSFQHGHTFMGHATAVAASLATIRAIKDENLLENVVVRGKELRKNLRKAFADHPFVGDVRGRGLFIGIEFVANRETKLPFDPASKIHKKIQATAMDHGLLCYGMGGTVDGKSGDHVLIAPPYIINSEQQHELVEKFTAAVSAALSGQTQLP
jgi:adenosylmethionine-8-amino-7-oxononanoate aminotransferase